MASAQDRSDQLAPIVEAARHKVAELEQRAQAMDAAASEAYRRADQAAGDAAHELAEAARRDVEPARARLATLLDAERVVSGERQRDQWAQQVAALKAREAEALDEVNAQLALLPMAVSAAKTAIRLARQAEQNARQAQGERLALEAELDGPAESGGLRFLNTRPTHNRADAYIGASPLLLTLERSNEF